MELQANKNEFKKILEIFFSSCKNEYTRQQKYGKVAQLARAFGSYPRGREFESLPC